jgi:histone H3/H4
MKVPLSHKPRSSTRVPACGTRDESSICVARADDRNYTTKPAAGPHITITVRLLSLYTCYKTQTRASPDHPSRQNRSPRSPMPPKGAVTAYFAFTEANRAAVQQELNEAAAAAAAAASEAAGGAADAGAADATAKPKSVSVAVVAKELGARWRALSEENREKYKELARQRTEAAAAAAAAAGPADGDAADDADADEQPDQQLPAFPRSIVKRIMACDPDFKRASADAVWLICAAAEALLGSIAERAAKQALGKRRKTVKLEDLQHVVK